MVVQMPWAQISPLAGFGKFVPDLGKKKDGGYRRLSFSN